MDILHFIEFAFIVIVGWTLSAMVLPRISLVSFRRRLFDSVDERKLHTAHIPRLGGIAFFPCITVTVSLAMWHTVGDFRVMLRQPIRVVRYLCHTLLHRSAVHSIRHRLYPERHQFDRRH